MIDSPVLSICIVNLRARDYLRACLESIYQSPQRVPFEIIVVDNASGDGSVEMLSECFPQVNVIVNDRNLGYTAPMNQALRAARGSYCVQLNPDTLVLPGALDTLYAYMQAHPQVGICTPKVLNRDRTLQKQCRRSAAGPWDTLTYFTGLSRAFPRSKTFAGYLMTYIDEDQVHEAEAVSGSCMFIRRAVLDQIGLLDELFFAYQEDADFCFRARQAGWKIIYNPHAQIVHYGGEGGSGVQVYRAVYEWHRSYYNYYRKNIARSYFFLINWLFYGLMGLKLVFAMLQTFFRKKKFAGTRKP
jgi:GT2 family glycosyltransferase